jgi:hypothetical protein
MAPEVNLILNNKSCFKTLIVADTKKPKKISHNFFYRLSILGHVGKTNRWQIRCLFIWIVYLGIIFMPGLFVCLKIVGWLGLTKKKKKKCLFLSVLVITGAVSRVYKFQRLSTRRLLQNATTRYGHQRASACATADRSLLGNQKRLLFLCDTIIYIIESNMTHILKFLIKSCRITSRKCDRRSPK